MTRRLAAALLTLLLLHPGPAPAASVTNDLVIYGGTSAGIIAAVQATRLGLSVVVFAPEQHLGWFSSGGLGFTDTTYGSATTATNWTGLFITGAPVFRSQTIVVSR